MMAHLAALVLSIPPEVIIAIQAAGLIGALFMLERYFGGSK